MENLQTTVTRSHEWRDGELYVIRKHTGKNGDNRDIIITTEEKGITPEEVNEVLEKTAPQKLEEMDRDISETEKKLEEQKKVLEEISDERLKEFEEYLETKEVKDLFEKLKTKKEKNKLEAQLQEKIKDKEDALDWKKQFERIKEDLQK